MGMAEWRSGARPFSKGQLQLVVHYGIPPLVPQSWTDSVGGGAGVRGAVFRWKALNPKKCLGDAAVRWRWGLPVERHRSNGPSDRCGSPDDHHWLTGSLTLQGRSQESGQDEGRDPR